MALPRGPDHRVGAWPAHRIIVDAAIALLPATCGRSLLPRRFGPRLRARGFGIIGRVSSGK
jgi:hypothetical protein